MQAPEADFREPFRFITHADSFDELKSYLAIEWTDAVIPGELESLAGALKVGIIILRDFIHIGVLVAHT